MAYTVVPSVVAGQKISATGYGNKVSTAIAELQDRQPTVYTGTGSAATGQTFASQTQVANFTVPATLPAGTVLLSGLLRVQKGTVTDTFAVRLYNNTDGVILAETQTYQGTSFEWVSLVGFAAVAANTTKTFHLAIQRVSGTGTASVVAGPANNQIMGVHYPTAP